jgi:hypothetical protein
MGLLSLVFFPFFLIVLMAARLETLDGSREGRLQTWKNGKIILEGGESLSVKNFISYKLRPVVEAAPGEVLLTLLKGPALRGKVIRWEEDGLLLDNYFLGKRSFYFDELASILFLDHAPSEILQKKLVERVETYRLSDDEEDQDVLFLESDQMPGLLEELKSGGISFELDEQSHRYAFSQVWAIRFPGSRAPHFGPIVLQTRDGSIFHVKNLNWTDKIRCQSSLGELVFVESDLSRIDFHHASHRFLGDFPPSHIEESIPGEEIPGTYPWPYQINKSVHHRRALFLDGRQLRQGIGVHSDSRLTWDLPEHLQELVGRCGLGAEAGEEGSVHFRVWADGEKLFDSGLMRAKEASKHFRLDLSGKKQLILEVLTDPESEDKDYTRDRAVWADLILVFSSS